MPTRTSTASRRRSSLSIVLGAIAAAAAAAGCSLTRPAPLPPTESAESVTGALVVLTRGPLLFDGSLSELYPCNDGDVVAYRVSGGPRSGELMVSRIFALSKPGEFRIANMYGDELTEALHLRIADDTVFVVSQVDAEQDVGITFSRPLPLVSAPLHAGVQNFRSPVRIWRPSSGRTMGHGEATLALSVSQERLTDYETAYAATQTGTFKLMKQIFELQSTAWLVPGLGEVQARRTQAGTETETFSLVCARIGGVDVVDCEPFAAEIDE